ncbi:MAG: glycogen debranching enzyme N-terminal domain-containing protein [Proteobacteria bacterium]|nr:glycogen debranching enzyme N-terminal domain-containing protein [Pseudomonadota bacterium]MBU4469318.1 glycogen debranching enzyme N-terminal domain-containing protein [Pseudomonadota bacterium]MCG2750797.1 glycogen debranching enzyme N-terminal domain-containing protein [Desulfobacteraceae bacterium]
MAPSLLLYQSPEPGTRLQRFQGDLITFELRMSQSQSGTAWFRTNIGHGNITRKEIIGHIEHHETPLKKDWFDIPMTPVDDRRFVITLALNEVGHFEGKCVFFETGSITPLWPSGENTVINVQPWATCGSNIIYNAFVRQFGKNKTRGRTDPIDRQWISALDDQGYTVIPPSGTFRDLIKELDFIMGDLGCRILQLLPINPTPTTFGRMGRFGSPYAALDFTAVDTALAEFDAKTTPMEQFLELVDAVHRRNGKILIDIAVNHTGWGAEIHETHPRWLVRDEEGKIENPGAWGVTWEDLTKLDYSHKDLWKYIARVFLTWCRRGVDGFRCDAGYMIPAPAWTYIIAKVRAQFPDTLFLLEGLGGKISVCRDLLNLSNFNWAYSELFQNYDRQQIEHYLPESMDISNKDGNLVHFAETHDNQRLAARSPAWAKMRTALCALTSMNGAFGFANGVEWLATEKIVVHDANSLNWGASENLVDHIRRINLLLRVHPAFQAHSLLKMIQTGEGDFIALARENPLHGKKLLVLVNLSDKAAVVCHWKTEKGLESPTLFDLLTGTPVTIQHRDQESACQLNPGQVLCLTPDDKDMAIFSAERGKLHDLPDSLLHQGLKSKVLDILQVFQSLPDLPSGNMDAAVAALKNDPEGFIRNMNPDSPESKIIHWDWPGDLKRQVMVPPGHFLLVRCPHPFDARMEQKNQVLRLEKSLIKKDEKYLAIFPPLESFNGVSEYTLKITVYAHGQTLHQDAVLLAVFPPDSGGLLEMGFSREIIHDHPLTFLDTNARGGMIHTPVSWGKLFSRYDALLAANLNPDFPVDRWIMFTRCRAWVVFQGYSYEINEECLNRFFVDENGQGNWIFFIPVGRGKHIRLTLKAGMDEGANAIALSFFRNPDGSETGMLEDDQPVQLILRPDIEDRSFHDTTKAYLGPEQAWPGAVKPKPDGFTFLPHPGRCLDMTLPGAQFFPKPEWYYMVFRSTEAERGLDPDSDLFSPGYFEALLHAGDKAILSASVQEQKPRKTKSGTDKSKTEAEPVQDSPRRLSATETLEHAMNQYVVKREAFSTVIAGYPWFLDWGRDTLIFLRGLIASEQTKPGPGKAGDILKQFGRFESRGTLPNMIRGDNAENRDTSDAPLWFCVACGDLIQARGRDFLEESCGTRTLRQVLVSIGNHYAGKTPNGISMDPTSGLIFSPSHYTWMDTNHPAGSPREGYPIEIQALWFRTLILLAEIDAPENAAKWKSLANRVKTSLFRFFKIEGMNYLSDCLHAVSGQSAEKARPDDALRPNQLLAVTLGAVDNPALISSIVTACQALLVPGAIRSLANQEIKHPLEVYRQGQLLNDPHHPYQGRYMGDEDTKRKPAYHNGTAWTWIFPSFSEAYAMAYGDAAKKTALSFLSSGMDLLFRGCVGHIPEILDGDAPHAQRGCDAQAWGASELYRVWKKLSFP